MSDETGNLPCPDCHVALVARSVNGVDVHLCPECAGVWMGGGALTALAAQSSVALLEIDRIAVPAEHRLPRVGADRWCPSCPQPLQCYRYETESPIRLDVCPSCLGVWVEKGELTQIEAWAEQHRLSRRLRSQRSADEVALEVARFTQEHEDFMAKVHALTTLFLTWSHR